MESEKSWSIHSRVRMSIRFVVSINFTGFEV